MTLYEIERDQYRWLHQRIYDALTVIGEKMPDKEWDFEWSASYGFGYEDCAPELIVRPFDWDWDPQTDDPDEHWPTNLEFGGAKIWWYKYLGRGMETDVSWDKGQWRKWVSDLEYFADEWIPND